MFTKNETINYGSNGVCEIVDITVKELNGKDIEYYVLKPVYDTNATIYVPTKSEKLIAKMRRVLTCDELMELMHTLPDEENTWIDDDRARQDSYRKIISSGDRRDMIGLIKSIYTHKQKQVANGKKLRAIDEKAMKDAEKLVYNEFALVLDIKPDEVLDFITNQLETQPQ